MRFATYSYEGNERAGVLDADDLLHPVDAGSLAEVLGDLAAAGAAALSAPPGPHVSAVRLLAPLRPPSVRDFVTFEEHVEGMRAGAGVPGQWYAAPTFYFTSPHAVLGPRDDVPVPPGCERFDFELEVAAVIGREGRDLTPEQARDHIAGYTICNDWSARDLQTAEMAVGLGPCKGKDGATTLGPWLVTPDELESRRDGEGLLRLALTAEVNGEVVGSDLLSNMSWTFEEMTAYASRGTPVRPGDVLASGTCGNGGCLAELWGRGLDRPALRPGDVVTLTVEGIGRLSTTVVAGGEAHPLPRARRRPRTRP
ncbi:2-keto-4-pentenoate hydratase/2-oxohepta-3-ene-1,7-dioic acid hydratase (catechol pathway) [Lentzea xinjiangensis]|uniref:2-keto-4-pentenoate hydratase/2-oxohepta-3-ene-1,7-dioic acid hydratase (Catechol pathway) n=1 Tax=Lentzea xinjiangensis TaxID=402600 RepID=A0A1H9UIP5_9PSEU|nr:fumarylacetoacetate hydrolase family protein [Lentzea xinjiangensis]SES09027.1 2-keto-4-pentenoate hydratase/2-oxohepta-3-ene-1,7-dioic acid hydratase (catechol pathway) [Lentzea xinjiangensis]